MYQLQGTAKKEYIEISGAAEVHGFDLKTKNCIVKISGSGKVETNVSDTLGVTISGIGTVVYQGKPVIAHKVINGLGKVKRGLMSRKRSRKPEENKQKNFR